MIKNLLISSIILTSFSLNAQRTLIAFLGNASTTADIVEADTKAAAQYTELTYGSDFKYLDVNTLVASDLEDVAVVFFYFDNTGSFELPGGGDVSSSVITMLADFVKEGGSLFLSGFATRIIDDIGRIPYEPGIAGNGNGGPNDDNWGMNFMAGMPQDVTSHAVYTGIAVTDTINPVAGNTLGHMFAPFISTGHKEDHNSMWDLGAIADLSEPHASVARGAEFEGLTNSTILGTWQHVTDMCCVAAAEFHPDGDFQGTIIAMGPAALEFSMDDNPDTVNPWESNGQLLVKNTIDYLKTLVVVSNVEEIKKEAFGVFPNPVQDIITIKTGTLESMHLTILDSSCRIVSARSGLIDGTSIDMSHLAPGVYTMNLYDSKSQPLKTIKVIKQ